MQVSARFGAQFIPPKPAVIFTDIPAKLTIRKILKAVSETFELDANDILSSRRDYRITLARQIVYYVALKLTRMSHPQIGRILRRDHTTIIHGRRRIEQLLWSDPSVSKVVAEIVKRLDR